MRRQTDPYGKAMKNKQKNKTKNIYFFQPLKVCFQTEILGILFKYIYIFCFILLFTSSSPYRKDQSAFSYFSTRLFHPALHEPGKGRNLEDAHSPRAAYKKSNNRCQEPTNRLLPVPTTQAARTSAL